MQITVHLSDEELEDPIVRSQLLSWLGVAVPGHSGNGQDPATTPVNIPPGLPPSVPVNVTAPARRGRRAGSATSSAASGTGRGPGRPRGSRNRDIEPATTTQTPPPQPTMLPPGSTVFSTPIPGAGSTGAFPPGLPGSPPPMGLPGSAPVPAMPPATPVTGDSLTELQTLCANIDQKFGIGRSAQILAEHRIMSVTTIPEAHRAQWASHLRSQLGV